MALADCSRCGLVETKHDRDGRDAPRCATCGHFIHEDDDPE